MAIRGIVFDLYGTLIYLEKNLKIFPRFFRDMNLDFSGELREMFMITNYECLDDIVKMLSPDKMHIVNGYETELNEEIDSARLFPDTMATLKGLEELDYKVGLISNVAYPYKRPAYDLGIDKHIPNLVFSCDVGVKKPDRKIFSIMSEMLCVSPEELLMVGDSMKSDFKGASDAGMQALLIDRKKRYDISQRADSLNGIFRYLGC